MRRWLMLLAGAAILVGCSGGTPSDADQQKMIQEWSPENVAKEYEKQGKMAEAEEVRRTAKMGQDGG
ncbi:MAG TPA: hypothetical protein PLX06_06995 [Fimbriimonadaceae bacterium]|nr:hypothetical protein [Fimbriimonadaceae bacterium]